MDEGWISLPGLCRKKAQVRWLTQKLILVVLGARRTEQKCRQAANCPDALGRLLPCLFSFLGGSGVSLGLWLHHSPICPLCPHLLLGTPATGFKAHPKDGKPPSSQLNSICKDLLCRQGHILNLRVVIHCGKHRPALCMGTSTMRLRPRVKAWRREGDGREGPEVQRQKKLH